jgi:hypothetical protein
LRDGDRALGDLEDTCDVEEQETDDGKQQDDVSAWANQNKETAAL